MPRETKGSLKMKDSIKKKSENVIRSVDKFKMKKFLEINPKVDDKRDKPFLKRDLPANFQEERKEDNKKEVPLGIEKKEELKEKIE